MSSCKNLILFQKIYDLILWLYPTVEKFPKKYQNLNGRNILETSLDLLNMVIKLNSLEVLKRIEYKRELSYNIDKLRILIRFSKDLRHISLNQYVFASKNVNEIVRLINSWIK